MAKNKSIGFGKGQTHPIKERVVKNSFKQRTVNIFSNFKNNSTPPWLEKIGIWVGVISACATIFFALFTLHSVQQIKGMNELLKSLNARVKIVPISVTYNTDTVMLHTKIMNFGMHSADNIIALTYITTPQVVHDQPSDTEQITLDNKEEILFDRPIARSYTDMDSKNKFYLSDEELKNMFIIFKCKFYDEATNQIDSTYTYAQVFQQDSSKFKLQLKAVTIKQSDSIKNLIRYFEDNPHY